MGEIKKIVHPISVSYICDECGGEMLQTGIIKPVSPPLYEHKCNICGHCRDFRRAYPYVEYTPEDDEISLTTKETYTEIDIMKGSEKIGTAEISGNELCRFNLYEPYQDMGYGQKALEQFIEKYHITKLCVASDNDRAIHVYEKAGFKKTKPYMYEMERSDERPF